MFLRLAAACLIFLWTAGSAAKAEECHANLRALGTSFPAANADQWGATLEAPAASCARGAGWASPWLVEAVPSSLPVGDAEQWAATLETLAGTSARGTEGAGPWLVEAVHSPLPVANAEEWAATLEAPAATSARWTGWESPWLVEAVHSSSPLAKAAHAWVSKVSTVSSPRSNATRHLGRWKIASLPSG
jgi:hypothetical protein